MWPWVYLKYFSPSIFIFTTLKVLLTLNQGQIMFDANVKKPEDQWAQLSLKRRNTRQLFFENRLSWHIGHESLKNKILKGGAHGWFYVGSPRAQSLVWSEHLICLCLILVFFSGGSIPPHFENCPVPLEPPDPVWAAKPGVLTSSVGQPGKVGLWVLSQDFLNLN